jgi:energy-coupling factor transporter ATP-binding protein EcfA2
MTDWNWNGARWWKFDFHAHTPASDDYGKGPQQSSLKGRTPAEWLLDYMRAGIDCVVVADHNSGAWIDRLRQALDELDQREPAGHRPLHLFGGVEITVSGGIHMLAVLGLDTATEKIDTLLGAVGFGGTKGTSDTVTTKTVPAVVTAITDAGGIALPAHVDEVNGLFTLQGTTLQQALDCGGIFAMEAVDPIAVKPGAYLGAKLSWTEVLGSDSHHPSGAAGQQYPGSRFTWVKMGRPGIEGLRLALLDGPLSVLRSDATSSDPNEHARLVLESVEVENARYMGRGTPFILSLNPWMNAVIGGRGTGKSTLIEFLRLALRRQDELPNALREDFKKYTQAYRSRDGGGLLADNTTIRVTYRKDGAVYRVQWAKDGSAEPIQQQTKEGWSAGEGDIGQRFPVRVYSQKQIFQMARSPLALLEVIDDAPEVKSAVWRGTVKMEESQYLSLRAQIREIRGGLSEEPRLKGELEDVERQLAVFEESGHAETLKALQKRRRQGTAVEEWEAGLADVGSQLRQLANEIVPEDLEKSSFVPDDSEDAELLEFVRETGESVKDVIAQVKGLAEAADHVVADWRQKKAKSGWQAAVDKATKAYDGLRARLESEGVADPSAYGQLVLRRQQIEGKLKELQGRREQIAELGKKASQCLDRVEESRREITQKRKSFLRDTLEGNAHVRISIVPYGAKELVESEFRQLIQRDAGGFEKDIGNPQGDGLLGALYADQQDTQEGGDGGQSASEDRLRKLKTRVREIAANPEDAGVADKRFAGHLAKLPPETFDRLDLWSPEDSPDVEYSTSSDHQTFRPIQEGSPGQKTAALLAFLLSYGEEPLILDQPEDDLDNHLIYDLIVTQLREVKQSRQVIVVTHNANIVVNGDAELVVALTARGGQTQTEADGCLQQKSVRQTICQVMEGGEKAFEQRYRRIALEVRRA